MDEINGVFIPSALVDEQKEIARKLRDGCRGGLKAFVKTFGCQQNEADSEKIRGICALCGYQPAGDADSADLVIINTCAIREHAELRALSGTGQLKKLKAKKPSVLIAVCGCMAEQEYRRRQIFSSYPYVDFIFGTDRLFALPSLIERALSGQRHFCSLSERSSGRFGSICEGLPSLRSSSYKAWLPIMYGCDNFCTYCVVPYVRGRERSRAPEAVISEAKELIASGCRDITLLGQNVNSYSGTRSFPALMGDIMSIDGDFWLRFMTSHPKDASEELVKVMGSSEKAARHFHLPVQSGSDAVLARMNRKYTSAQYLEKVGMIRENLPSAAVTSDIICGFPGETDEDFLKTLELAEKVRFDMLYIFVFSPRPGSAAAKMDGQIPHEEKVKRFEALSALQNGISEKINEGYTGRTLKVLSDGVSDGVCSGRCSQNKIVTLDRPVPAGEFVNAEITASRPYALAGRVKP